ncbi:MAG: catechol-2,3-dioxygenase [Cyclobacteriaceae bacterium]|jgi:catechol-2,3-dioxygenase
MKRILIALSLIWIPFWSPAQTDSNLDLEAYFSAVIVSDIGISNNWYSNVLGFTVVSMVESKERGFKQSNLKKEAILIELIELDNAVSSKEVVPNYTNKTRIIGFFKTGFLVSDFSKWIKHLATEKVDFYGDIITDDKTGKKMMIITDPDGNRIQIFEK